MSQYTPEYRKAARDLVIKRGRRMKPTEIYKELGNPPKGVRLKSDGRGNVTTEPTDKRAQRRSKANKERTINRKISTGSLTSKERAQNRAQEEEKRQRRAAGEDVEILHDQRLGLTGRQLRDVAARGGSVTKARRKLKEAYGGAIGDKPANRRVGSGDENRQEEADWQNVERRLGEMEQQQPSVPPELNHPDLIQAVSQVGMATLTFVGAAARLTWNTLTDFGM